MRYLVTSMCLAMSATVTATAWAQDAPPNDEDPGQRRAEMRRRIMAEFDADGDGELSDDERAKAREQMRSRRGNRGGGEGDAPRGNRASRGGPEGRPEGRPDPEALFNRLDTDGNGSLSRAEFRKMAEQMRPPGSPRRPGSSNDARPQRRQRDGAGPDGPSQEGRRRFDRQRPLQNPDDEAAPRRRPQRRGRPNDKDAQGPPRNRGARGAGLRGPQGAPDPDALFDRLDRNEDGELSREEFMRFAQRMQQMRDRGMRPGGGQRPPEGRGPGRRRAADAEEGAPRRRRPARPQFDDDVTLTPSQTDDSV